MNSRLTTKHTSGIWNGSTLKSCLRFKVLTFDGVLCAAKTENIPHGDTSYDDSTYWERHSAMYF